MSSDWCDLGSSNELFKEIQGHIGKDRVRYAMGIGNRHALEMSVSKSHEKAQIMQAGDILDSFD